jgi:hypothetical protein
VQHGWQKTATSAVQRAAAQDRRLSVVRLADYAPNHLAGTIVTLTCASQRAYPDADCANLGPINL